MQEYLLGKTLQTLMDFYNEPCAYNGVLPADTVEEADTALRHWWKKYLSVIEEDVTQ